MKQAECQGIPLREITLEEGGRLEVVNFKHLTLTVCAAVWACDVRRDAAFAFRACFEFWGAPTVCASAHFLFHFGCSSLGYSHGISGLRVSGLGVVSERCKLLIVRGLRRWLGFG